MKYLLTIIIRIYWKYIPENKRRICLFNVSCSNYVYKKANEEGLISGIKALNYRIKNCNPNYYIVENNGKRFLISSLNKTFSEEEINQSILN